MIGWLLFGGFLLSLVVNFALMTAALRLAAQLDAAQTDLKDLRVQQLREIEELVKHYEYKDVPGHE